MDRKIIFDNMQKKEVVLFPNEKGTPEYIYDIGELLLDFIELDLSDFEQRLESIKNNSNECNIDQFFSSVVNLLEDYAEKHIYFNADYFSFSELCMDIVNAKKKPGKGLPIKGFDKLTNLGDLLNDFKIREVQEFYKKAIEYCLNIDSIDLLKDLSIPQRFMVYNEMIEPGFLENNRAYSSYTIKPPIPEDIFYNDLDGDMKPKELTKDLVNCVKSLPVKVLEANSLSDIKSICYLEFMKMVSLNIAVKRCKNCNRLFIYNSNYNLEYCDRTAPSELKTCKEIGAIRTYQNRIKMDPILEVYNKAYKTHNARVRYKKMSRDEFYQWSEQAKVMRDNVKNGAISLTEFIEWCKK